MKKTYCITMIFKQGTRDTFFEDSYSECFKECIKLFNKNKGLVACLIYSETTHIVIKRKHALR